MSLSAAVLKALVEAGATKEQLVAAMQADIAERESIEIAKLEAKRAGNRKRQQAKRERERNTESRVTDVTERDRALQKVPLEVSPQTPLPKPLQNTTPSPLKGVSPKAWALPAGVSLRVWEDFKSNRKRKKLGNTETAWKGFNDDLKRISAQTGIPPPKLIEMCTAKGWGSINDPREERTQRNERSNNPLRDAVSRIVANG